MKHFAFLITLALIVVSCGTDSKHFKLEGRLLHLNQGEFYVYTPDGQLSGIDTIRVQAGRFTYETPCDKPMTLMIVFPNYTEQPIFAQPGKSVDVKGDASHLKEMTVKGTKDNELMTSFRKQVASSSPDEARHYAAQFVADHPESAVGIYLTRKYFLQTPTPDYTQARKLVATMLEAQQENVLLRRLSQQLQGMGAVKEGDALPSFTATTIDGKSVGTATLRQHKVVAVCVWASWNYESIGQLRTLLERQKTNDFEILTICLDGSADECRKTLEKNKFTCPTICDGEMLDGKLFRLLGFSSVPNNLVIRNGKMVCQNVDGTRLQKEVIDQ